MACGFSLGIYRITGMFSAGNIAVQCALHLRANVQQLKHDIYTALYAVASLSTACMFT